MNNNNSGESGHPCRTPLVIGIGSVGPCGVFICVVLLLYISCMSLQNGSGNLWYFSTSCIPHMHKCGEVSQ